MRANLMNPKRLSLPLHLVLSLGATLWAGTAYADTLNTRVGDEIVLASYYEIRPENCMALRAPSVRITHEPIIGSAMVLRTQGQASAPSRCVNVAVPIAEVRYRALHPGTDLVRWQVSYQAKGRSTEQATATIKVAPGP